MRFYLDEHFSSAIAEVCRRRGVDVVTTHELRHNGASDEDQLVFAAREDRCVVTRDYADFSRWTTQFMERELPHAGVLIVPPSFEGDEYSAIAEAIIHFDVLYEHGLPPYAVMWLTRAPRES